MAENAESFLTSNWVQKTAAVFLILMGLLQAVVGLTQDTLPWMLFYGITGLSIAICGGLFLRDTMNSGEQ